MPNLFQFQGVTYDLDSASDESWRDPEFLEALASLQEGWCWFEPRPNQHDRYDQQRAFYDDDTTGVCFLVGGNGAGTSTVALAKVVKFLLSTPPPRKDTPFWLIANSYEQVCNALWKEKLDGMQLLPARFVEWDRISWIKSTRNWPGFVPLTKHENGNNWALTFKSYEQNLGQMMAESIGGFLFSEQFPWDVLTEVLRGCREYNFPGSKIVEYTPVNPELSVELEEMIDNGHEPDHGADPNALYLPDSWNVWRANTECAMEAGHVSEEWFREFFGMVPPEMRETRLTGAFASYEGAIYQGFNKHVHLIGDEVFDLIGDHCYHYRGIDWGSGPENDFACVWGFRDPEGAWCVYDEYSSNRQVDDYGRPWTVIDHLKAVQDQWPWPENMSRYGATYCDPANPDDFKIAASLNEYAPDYEPLNIERGYNSVLVGIEHLQHLLQQSRRAVDPDTGEVVYKPKLFIHATNCPKLVRQMRTYRWLKSTGIGVNPKDAKREPLKKNDHLVDALRYMIASQDRARGAMIQDSARRHSPAVNRAVQLQRHKPLMGNSGWRPEA